MKRKYTVICFSKNKHPLKLRLVSRDFRSLFYWLVKNGYDWTAINVYDRYAHEFIIQLKNSPYYWTQIESL